MKKKTIIIIILSILAIILVSVTVKLALDYKKEDKIRNEVKEITQAIESQNSNDSFNKIINRRLIKGGQYEKVEDLIKLYYRDVYNNLSNLNFLLDEDNFISYLTVKNLKEDAPKFLKSRDNLNNSKAQIEEHYDSLMKLLDDDYTKAQYLEDKNIDIYYRNFYLELTNAKIKDEIKNEIKKEYMKALENIKIYNEAFDFLAVHESNWTIKNETIAIENPVLNEEYNNIIKKLDNEKKE